MTLPIIPNDVDLGEYAKPFDRVEAIAAYLLSKENDGPPVFEFIRRHISNSREHGDNEGLYFEMVFDAIKIIGLEPSIDRIFTCDNHYAMRWCVVRHVVRVASGMLKDGSV